VEGVFFGGGALVSMNALLEGDEEPNQPVYLPFIYGNMEVKA
jgi:hypothetical protein